MIYVKGQVSYNIVNATTICTKYRLHIIDAVNSILNRRKSRAGKSLKNHLAAIFDGNQLQYEAQIKLERNKKTDFIFRGTAAYNDSAYSADKLVFLGVKTTCKDRWRQIINEANRIGTKQLFYILAECFSAIAGRNADRERYPRCSETIHKTLSSTVSGINYVTSDIY